MPFWMERNHFGEGGSIMKQRRLCYIEISKKYVGKDYCLSKAQALSVSAVFRVFGILDKVLIQLQKSLNTA